MKTFKRFAALLIAAMMVIGTVVPTMATESTSKSIKVTYHVDTTNGERFAGDTSQTPAATKESAPQTVDADHPLATFQLSEKAEKPGKTFLGWVVGSATGTQPFPAISVSDNTDVYAKFSDAAAKEWTVTFDKNGLDADDFPAAVVVTVPEGQDTTTFDASKITATRKGYTLEGWTATQAESKDLKQTDPAPAADVIVTTITVDGDKTLYPIWRRVAPKTLNITYDPNGGQFTDAADGSDTATLEVSDDSVEYILKGVTPTRTDSDNVSWAFKGWAETPDETDVTKAVTKQNLSADKTYYAMWERPVTITYNINGGVDKTPAIQDATETGTIAVGKKSVEIALRSDGPTLEGYTFKGWSATQVDKDTPISTITKIDAKVDTTVYAVFEKNATIATSDANGNKTFKISVNKDDEHQYKVYEILTGTLGDDPNRLGDPKWGKG